MPNLRPSLNSRLVALLAVAPVVIVAACGKTLPPPGELVVAVATDLSIPKDIDQIRVQVLWNGTTPYPYDNTFYIRPGGPAGVKIPATLGILAGSDPTIPALVRVIAISHDQAIILREAS